MWCFLKVIVSFVSALINYFAYISYLLALGAFVEWKFNGERFESAHFARLHVIERCWLACRENLIPKFQRLSYSVLGPNDLRFQKDHKFNGFM